MQETKLILLYFADEMSCMQAAVEQAGGLVEAVLGMLGLEEKDVTDGDTLESLGMDSMQVAEIRSRLQRALGRPIPLEEARPAPSHQKARAMPCYQAVEIKAALGMCDCSH